MKRFILLFLAICLFQSLVTAKEDLITPGNFILKSSLQETSLSFHDVPHSYDIQTLGTYNEPYIPTFFLKDYQLPRDIASNNERHWLSDFSSFLAKSLIPEKAILDNGLQFYLEKDYLNAIDIFQKGIQLNGKLKNTLQLWLAWSYYKTQQFEKSLDVLSNLIKKAKRLFKYEAYYLSSLIHIEEGKFQDAFNELNRLQHVTDFSRWTFKLQYAYLITLVELHHWNDVLLYLSVIEKNPIRHLKQYNSLLESKALALFYLDQKPESLNTLKELIEVQTGVEQLSYSYRMLAWVAYLEGRYSEAFSYIKEIKSDRFEDEILYLNLSCHLELKEKVTPEHILKNISKKSIFYIYGSFKLQVSVQNNSVHPELFQNSSDFINAFPNLRFYSTLTQGNYYFKNKQYKKAQSAYFQALSADTENKSYWKTHYNLGLSYLASEKYTKALTSFSLILKQRPSPFTVQVAYHRLFSLFKLKSFKPFKKLLSSLSIEDFNHTQRIEVLSMAGVLEHHFGDKDDAISYFIAAWKESKNSIFLSYAVQSLYQNKKYQKIVQLVDSHPLVKNDSEPVLNYYIKSLLALEKNQIALEEILKHDFTSAPFNALKIEVWFVNNQNQEIIDFITSRLRKKQPDLIRQSNYLSLGDAYFNLQQHLKAKTQYYKALHLTSEVDRRSSILFNIATVSQLMNDSSSFQQEVLSILSEQQLSTDIRFNLTILLTNSYVQSKLLSEADAVLKDYLLKFQYKETEISLKRAVILHQQGRLEACFKLSKKAKKGETLFQKTDRYIALSNCSQTRGEHKQAIRLLKDSILKDPSYRIDERYHRLAYQLFATNQYQAALQQIKNIRLDQSLEADKQNVLLLHANILKNLKREKEALLVLGDLDPYKLINKYVEASILKSALLTSLQKFSEAEKTLLKASYLKGHPSSAKAKLQLKLGEINLKKGDKKRAYTYLNNIILEDLDKKDQDDLKKYQSRFSVVKPNVPRETR